MSLERPKHSVGHIDPKASTRRLVRRRPVALIAGPTPWASQSDIDALFQRRGPCRHAPGPSPCAQAPICQAAFQLCGRASTRSLNTGRTNRRLRARIASRHDFPSTSIRRVIYALAGDRSGTGSRRSHRTLGSAAGYRPVETHALDLPGTRRDGSDAGQGREGVGNRKRRTSPTSAMSRAAVIGPAPADPEADDRPRASRCDCQSLDSLSRRSSAEGVRERAQPGPLRHRAGAAGPSPDGGRRRGRDFPTIAGAKVSDAHGADFVLGLPRPRGLVGLRGAAEPRSSDQAV